jgi:hypothetical protein
MSGHRDEIAVHKSNKIQIAIALIRKNVLSSQALKCPYNEILMF